MFVDKLDPQAVKAVLSAQDEARRQGHQFVDTEHLLLGLLSDSQGVPARVLGFWGLKHQDLRKRVNEKLGQGEDFVGMEAPFTDRLNRLFESAWEHAGSSGKTSISTVDLLISLAETVDGTAGEIFSEAGLSKDRLLSEIDSI